MQSINCCQSCKTGENIKEECKLCNEKSMLETQCLGKYKEKTREISILGKPLTVKNYICSADGINYKEKPENIQLQLFVNMLTFCPAGCRFCVAKNTKLDKKIDIDKLKQKIGSGELR